VTRDGGVRWTRKTSGLQGAAITAVATSAGPPAVIYAGSAASGVFVSSDGGESWKAFSVGLEDRRIRFLTRSPDGGRLFAGTHGAGLYEIEIAAPRACPGGEGPCRRPPILIGPRGAGALSGSSGERSARGAFTGGGQAPATAAREWSANESDSRRPPILVEPRRPPVEWVATGPFAGSTPTALLSDPGGPNLYAAIDEVGVFRKGDVESDWKEAGSGLTSTRLSSLAPHLIAPPSPTGCPPPCYGPAIIYAGTRGDGVFVLRDGRWTSENSGLTDLDVTALAQGVLAGTAGGQIFRNEFSFVGPQTWSAVASPGDETAVLSLAVGSEATVFCGTQAGLYRSTDFGASWSPLAHNAVQFLADVRAIEIDPSDPSVVFAAGILTCNICGIPAYPSIVKSTDGGESWTEITGNIGNPFVRSLLSAGGGLFAGTAGGVFRSVDGEASWTDAGLDGFEITSLAQARSLSDETVAVAAGAVGGGIYQAEFPVTTPGDDDGSSRRAPRTVSPRGP
jgi:photosystem II stability/assembly factor-like uncharacterized protein